MRAAQHDMDSDDEPEYHRVEIAVKIPYPPGFLPPYSRYGFGPPDRGGVQPVNLSGEQNLGL